MFWNWNLVHWTDEKKRPFKLGSPLETLYKALPGWGWKDVVPAKTWRSTSIRLQSLSASIQIADLKINEKCQISIENVKKVERIRLQSLVVSIQIHSSRSEIIQKKNNFWTIDLVTNRDTKHWILLIVCIKLFSKIQGRHSMIRFWTIILLCVTKNWRKIMFLNLKICIV